MLKGYTDQTQKPEVAKIATAQIDEMQEVLLTRLNKTDVQVLLDF